MNLTVIFLKNESNLTRLAHMWSKIFHQIVFIPKRWETGLIKSIGWSVCGWGCGGWKKFPAMGYARPTGRPAGRPVDWISSDGFTREPPLLISKSIIGRFSNKERVFYGVWRSFPISKGDPWLILLRGKEGFEGFEADRLRDRLLHTFSSTKYTKI